MRLNQPDYRMCVSRDGIHRLRFHIGGLRWDATETESRQLAHDILNIIDKENV